MLFTDIVQHLALLITSAYAAHVARKIGHITLSYCYLANAIIYGMLELFHWFQLAQVYLQNIDVS